jgi:hypothetical protein
MFKGGKATRALIALGFASMIILAAPASGQAAAKFGSKLNKNVQPSNGAPGLKCSPDATQRCTFLLNEAYAPPNPDGKQFAPKTGTIGKVELIAATPGHFQLGIAKLKSDEKAKKVAQGPKITYKGSDLNGNTFNVESFNVNLPIKKGQVLTAQAKKISFVRCSSGGPNTLIYQPPLSVNAPFASPSGSDGCWMLLEAFYK